MEANKNAPVQSSRVKTDKSLKGERNKTDDVIEIKNGNVEEVADKQTQKNREVADKNLAKTRAHTDSEKKSEHLDSPSDKELITERERSDKDQAVARLEEDQIRNKERFQKKLLAEALLKNERKETDDNLLDERERTDTAHDLTKTDLMTRDQFLAVVSHDLRNPLSSVSMGASLIRAGLTKGGNKEDLFKFLEIIERSAANMDRMISDLLDVERMSNNKLFLNLEMNNIGELLQECVDLFAPIVLSKSFSMTINPSSETIFSEIDHDKVLQVLSNLTGNSLKFSPRGSIITLSARKLDQDVELSVSDNGPGIPEDKMTEIFERFSQLKTNDRSGLGLGLFISKWIVEAHNGRIWVESKIGAGSSFIFTLPISKKH